MPSFISQRAYWLALIVFLWGALVGTSLWFNIQSIQQHSLHLATEGGRNMFRALLLSRMWNAQHGGVYVPVDANTQPNLYLHHPRREITTTDGQRLTMINPAYMTRMLSELAERNSDTTFHITSLNPLRPQNAPDTWEREALLGFTDGKREAIGVDYTSRQGRVLRYMAPLEMKPECARCHVDPVGSVRGGISISLPYWHFESAAEASIVRNIVTHVLFFLLLTGVSWWSLEQLRRYYSALLSNIDELKAARNELVHSEKMASLGRMVAGFAHEINTPIGIAVGAISHENDTLREIKGLLAQEEVEERVLLEKLDTLDKGGTLALGNLQRAARLVQSLKRTSVDMAARQPRIVAIHELLQDVLLSLQNLLKRLPLKVNIQCPETLKIYASPDQLVQLFTNLIINSVQHGFEVLPEGAQPQIDINVSLLGDKLDIDYRDNGCGMTPEVLAQAFEPFFTTCRKNGGSGLGLFICYNIINDELHGTIRCESAPAQGCRFHMSFPVRLPDPI